MIHPEHRERILKLHADTKEVLAARQADKAARIAVRKSRQAASGFPGDKSPV